MKRETLDAEINRLVSELPTAGEKYGFHSDVYRSKLARLRSLRIERMKRDTHWRKRRRAA